jgi:hypothetical protein
MLVWMLLMGYLAGLDRALYGPPPENPAILAENPAILQEDTSMLGSWGQSRTPAGVLTPDSSFDDSSDFDEDYYRDYQDRFLDSLESGDP